MIRLKRKKPVSPWVKFARWFFLGECPECSGQDGRHRPWCDHASEEGPGW